VFKINPFGFQDFCDLGEGTGTIVNEVFGCVVTKCNSLQHKVWPRHNFVVVIFLHGWQTFQGDTLFLVQVHSSWQPQYTNAFDIPSNKYWSFTRSMISWKCTDTAALSKFWWLVELWMSSDTLFSRICFHLLHHSPN